jgi:Tol biopolymer transport system component
MKVHGGGAASTPLARTRGVRRRGLFAVGVVAALAGAAPAAAEAANGNIAFMSNPAGHYRINVMNTNGIGMTLNANPRGAYDDEDPAWSPDGTKIAFASDRGGNYDIYVMNTNGTGVKQLTSEPRADRYPAWSPDGTKIAFRGYAGATGGAQIFTMSADGTGAHAIPHTGGGDQPSWALDGRRIAFTNTVAAPGPALEIVDTSSGAVAPLTSGASDRYPAWSPDGASIAFRRLDPTGQGREVWAIAPDGSGASNLSTVLGAPARSASWAPDGKGMVFVSYRDADHNQEIWLGSRDGSSPARQLTFTTWTNDEPRWANVPVGSSPVPPSKPGGPASGGTAGGGIVGGTGKVALAVSLRVPHQRLGRRGSVRARVRCNQACSVLVTGSFKPKGKNALRLRRSRHNLAAGRWTTVKVSLGARARRSIRAALRRHRRARVILDATARTSAGAFTPAVTKALLLRR